MTKVDAEGRSETAVADPKGRERNSRKYGFGASNVTAAKQVLVPLFDPGFSESGYGFRPGRSAHQAVLKAREYVAGGRRWVVDMDLEKFSIGSTTTCLCAEWPARSKIGECCE